jgi:hypothetical protein
MTERQTDKEADEMTIWLFIHLFILYRQFAFCVALRQDNQSIRCKRNTNTQTHPKKLHNCLSTKPIRIMEMH